MLQPRKNSGKRGQKGRRHWRHSLAKTPAENDYGTSRTVDIRMSAHHRWQSTKEGLQLLEAGECKVVQHDLEKPIPSLLGFLKVCIFHEIVQSFDLCSHQVWVLVLRLDLLLVSTSLEYKAKKRDVQCRLSIAPV